MFNRIRNVRKRWFVLAATVALLSIGLVGGSAFAAGATGNPLGKVRHYASGQHGYGHGAGDRASVLARVAEIVGVEQDTLESAFQTAFDEQAETRFADRVDTLVADATLTEAEGNAAKTWFEARPDLSGAIAIRLAGSSDSDQVDGWLSRLVGKEKLTQDEADALSEWHDDRPESLPQTKRRHHGKRGYDHAEKS